jgi:hypothetical protein
MGYFWVTKANEQIAMPTRICMLARVVHSVQEPPRIKVNDQEKSNAQNSIGR